MNNLDNMWPMTTAQRNQSQEFNTENADIVFVLEDTSNLYSHFSAFKYSYLNKLLE